MNCNAEAKSEIRICVLDAYTQYELTLSNLLEPDELIMEEFIDIIKFKDKYH